MLLADPPCPSLSHFLSFLTLTFCQSLIKTVVPEKFLLMTNKTMLVPPGLSAEQVLPICHSLSIHLSLTN